MKGPMIDINAKDSMRQQSGAYVMSGKHTRVTGVHELNKPVCFIGFDGTRLVQ